MNYDEAVAFVDARVRLGMSPGLERIAELVELLDHPERTYPSIHVTGTNGKFSVASMTSAILAELGLTVGTYTSPHIETVRERIAVGGVAVDETTFADVLTYLEPYIGILEQRRDDHLTYFETLTAMALEHFFDVPVHAAVLEVGLGGEFDATNVADARVAVITKISRDHMREFGDLERAAWEKAGVVKEGAHVLSGVEQPELAEIVARRAAERGAGTVSRFGIDFDVEERTQAVGGQVVTVRGLHGTYRDLYLPVYGAHQARNLAFALAACEAFGDGALDAGGVAQALDGVRLPGRLEVVSRHPLVVLDGAHNPDAAAAILSTVLQEFAYDRSLAVVGMLDDKAVEEVLTLLASAFDRFVLTAPDAERAAPASRLAEAVSGKDAIVVDDVGAAVARALDEASRSDLVLVLGSFYTVGEARTFLRSRGLLPQS